MRSMLVNMGAAPRKRSWLLLLLLAGLFNVASATTYYTATTGTATLTSLSSYSGIYTNIGATTAASGTLLATDVITVQGATLTTNVSIVVAATSGGLIVPAGTVTISTASTFTTGVTISGGTISANAAVSISGTSFTTFTESSTTSSGTTLNCVSTAGMYVGEYLTKVSGTGVFNGNTFVTKIINSTSCLVSVAPTTAFVSGDTYQGFVAGSALTMTSGTFSLATAITANIYGDLSVATGAVYQHLGTANTNLWGNLIMTGGAVGNQTSNTSSSTFQLYGNLAGNASASARGWGTFQERSASTYTFRFSFARSNNFGVGGSTSAITSSATIATDGTQQPQLINFVSGTSSDGGSTYTPSAIGGGNSTGIYLTSYVKVVGNSALPQGVGIAGKTGIAGLIDLNGYTLALGVIYGSSGTIAPAFRGGAGSGGNSILQINGTSGAGPAYAPVFDQSTPGTTDLINLCMPGGAGTAANDYITLGTNITMNAKDITLTGASSSSITVTCASTTGLYVGNTVTVTSGTGAFAAKTYVTSIIDGTRFTVSAAPSTALSGATIAATWLGTGNVFLNGKTITMSNSISGNSASCFAEGVSATLFSGTTGGVKLLSPASTAITVPLGYSTATANTATYAPITFTNTTGSPSNLLVGVAPLVSANVLTSANCVPSQWYITAPTAGPFTSDITFGATGTTGIGTTTTANSTTTSQLGVVLNNTGGYTGMTTNLANATSTNPTTSIYSATYAGYSLPTNTTLNTYVVGNGNSVYPFPVLNAIADQTVSTGGTAVNITLSGTDISSFTASGKPSWLTVNYTNVTTGSITGNTQSSASTNSITINAINIAGSNSKTFSYIEGSTPSITSASTATAIISGTALSYAITTSASADLYSITSGSLPTGLSLSSSTGVISGTPSSGTSGSYTVTLTATNTTSNLTSAPFTLTILVLDVPTVTTISPATSAVDTTGFTLTVNGTNFVSGKSTVTWAGSNLPTTFVSSTQLTATVSSSLVAHGVSSATPAVGVTNAGTNASPTTPLAPSSSSNTTNYTITVATPTLSSIDVVASVAGASTSLITLTGTNFISGVSAVTFNGSTTGVTTTYYSSTSITATLSSTLLASAGTYSIGVSNIGAGLNIASSATKSFTVYSAGAAWAFSTNGAPVIAGANISSASTLAMSTTASTNILPINTANVNTTFVSTPFTFVNGSSTILVPVGLRYTPSTTGTANIWPNLSLSVNSNFVGTYSDGSSSYLQFDVAPDATHNFTVSNITFPFTNSTKTQATGFQVAYSLDGFNTYTLMSNYTNTIPASSTSISPTNLAYNYTTQIIVPAGQTLSVRFIPRAGSTGLGSTESISLANVVIAGTTSLAYGSPTITSATGTVSGDAAITYTSGSPLYTFEATTVSGHANTYSASGLSGTGYSLDATTGAITGQYNNSAGGTFNATLTADNGNLYPVSTTLTFDIAGIPVTPTTTSISPATAVVDGAQFTITVNGTNFVSGKSAVTWNGNALTTTYVSSTQLTAIVPASLLAGSSISAATAAVGVYNTGAATPNSNNQTFTITNITPSLIVLSPSGIVAGNSGFTLTVYGTNFTTASKITWNGTQYTTTFVSSRSLTATINSGDIASRGTATIGVTNVFPGSGSTNAATTRSFIIGNATASWTTTSLTPTTLGDVVGTNTTLTGMVAAATSGVYSFGQTSGTAYSGDGGNATTNASFSGISADAATTSTTTSTRSIDFQVTPASQNDMTISAVTIPMFTNGNVIWYSVGYSTDGVNFTKITTSTNSAGLTVTPPTANTNDIQASFTTSNSTPNTVVTNYVFPTPVSVPNGSTFTLRVIVWRKGGSTTATVNIGSVSIVGNTTASPTPYAPSITSLSDGSSAVDVSFTAPAYTGTTAITSYKVYAYANGSATASTSASVNVSSLTLPYHINVTGLTNGTSYTFKVSATNGSGEGNLSTASDAVVPSNNTTWTITNGVGSWDHGDPDLGDQNATINGNYTLTKALNCLKLTVANGVTVALGNFNFTVQGNLVNNGTLSGNGTLLLNTTAAQTITGTGTVGNVTINNTSGGVSVTTGNMFNVSGVLTLQRGTLTTNGLVTFKSTSIANTGTLAAIDGVTNTGSISGTVTVERYIPAGFRGYRDLAPEVNNAGSIYNNWQEGGAFTSGKGIFITGPSATDAVIGDYSTQPVPNATSGLDYSVNGVTSAYAYTNSTASWNSGITNTKTTTLYPFGGYRVLVRGDRSFNLATTPIVNYYNFGLRMVNPTVLRATGNVVTGTVTYSTGGVTNGSVGATYQSSIYGINGTTNKFSMIANPYIAPVLWGTGSGTQSSTASVYGASSNINGSYYYYDTKFGSTGTYAAYNAVSGSVYAGNTTSGYIQPGQAFFIQTSGASPTVVFKETAKATSVAKVAVFGAAAPLSKIYISLLKQDATNTYNNVDAAAIAFHESFTNATYGPQDAIKFGNNNDNLSISDKGKTLSIDGRLPATATDKIPVNIGNVSGTAYQLDIDATTYSANGFAPYLVDSYRGTTATLTSGLNSFKFTVDATIAASFENRFSIAFKPTTLAVNSIVASATLNNKIATISWNTVGEKGVSRFEVEKSTDAKSFFKIGQASAKNTATATYTTTDNNTTAATNYYRIKAISEVGTVSYSNVAKLTTSAISSYSLYPNPLKGTKVVNVSLTNVAAGKYTVTINNVLGQRVQEVAISHAGGSVSHAITINNALAAGTYSVTIRETASGQLVHQTNLSVQP